MKENKILLSIVGVVLLDLIGVGILLPIIPVLLTDSGSDSFLLGSRYTLEQGYIIMGALVGIYSLMQFLASPILGQMSDRFGRKKVLIVSLIGTALSYILFAVGIILVNIPLLFISRILDGITGGNISVAKAVIADITEPAHRAKNFALIGAAYGLGFILGPIIGSRLSDPTFVSWFNSATPFYFAALLSVINIIMVTFMLEETLITRSHKPLKGRQMFINIKNALRETRISRILTLELLYVSGFAFFVTFLGVHLIERFSMGQREIGNFFSILGIWIIFAQLVTTRQLANYFSSKQLLSFSILTTSATIFLFYLSTETIHVYMVIPFIAMANGLTLSNMSALISGAVDKKRQGEIMGIQSSVQAIGQSVPPILSGFVAALVFPSAPILAGSLLIFAGAIFYYFSTRKHFDY